MVTVVVVVPGSLRSQRSMGESPRKTGPAAAATPRAILEQQCVALQRLVSEGEKMQQRGVAPIAASYRNVPIFARRPGPVPSFRPFYSSLMRPPPPRPYRFVSLPRSATNNAHRVWKKPSATPTVPHPPPSPAVVRVVPVGPVLPTPIPVPTPLSTRPTNQTPSNSTGFSGPIRPIVKLNSRARFRLVDDHIAAKLLKEEQEKQLKLTAEKKKSLKFHSPSKYKVDRRVPKLLAESVTLGGLNLSQRRCLIKQQRTRQSSFSIQRFSLKRRKKLSLTELDLNLSTLSQQQKTPIRLATRFVRRSKQHLLKKQKKEKSCVFFVRTGVCGRKEEGKCPFVHDPAKRLLCQRFLKNGVCEVSGCALSHDKEKGRLPPPCRFFRRGRCTKNADECPFSHCQDGEKTSKKLPPKKKKEEAEAEGPQGRYFEMHPDSQPEEAVIPRRLPKGCLQEVSNKKPEDEDNKQSSPESSSSSSEDEEVIILEEKRKPPPPPAFIGFRR